MRWYWILTRVHLSKNRTCTKSALVPRVSTILYVYVHHWKTCSESQDNFILHRIFFYAGCRLSRNRIYTKSASVPSRAISALVVEHYFKKYAESPLTLSFHFPSTWIFSREVDFREADMYDIGICYKSWSMCLGFNSSKRISDKKFGHLHSPVAESDIFTR